MTRCEIIFVLEDGSKYPKDQFDKIKDKFPIDILETIKLERELVASKTKDWLISYLYIHPNYKTTHILNQPTSLPLSDFL